MLKNFFIVIAAIAVITSTQSAHAEVEICFEGLSSNPEMAFSAAYRCDKVKKFEESLQVTMIGLSLVSLGASCTGVGIPVTVVVGVTAAAMQYLALKVKSLPCEEARSVQDITNLMVDAVCDTLIGVGLECRPFDILIVPEILGPMKLRWDTRGEGETPVSVEV